LRNKGLIAVQPDGIHFYDENKAEIELKKIIFETQLAQKKK
jgi:hypothetical protein